MKTAISIMFSEWYLCECKKGFTYTCEKTDQTVEGQYFSKELKGSKLVPVCKLNPFKKATIWYKLYSTRKVEIIKD